MLFAHFEPILTTCRPYLFTTDLLANEVNLSPFGVQIPEDLHLNPQHRKNADFIQQTKRLDELTYGPVGMPMPEWVFYDCAVMPGVVFGLARSANDLEYWVRAALQVPDDYDGAVPLSLFIAIPMLEEATWLLYTLCDINRIAPGAGPAGLSLLSLVLGVKVLGARKLYGTIQWRAPMLETVSQLGPLDVVAAYTSAHSFARTLTYSAEISDENLQAVLAGAATHPANPVATFLLDVDDEELLKRVQQEVEGGVRWRVVGPPRTLGAFTQIPMCREVSGGEPLWS